MKIILYLCAVLMNINSLWGFVPKEKLVYIDIAHQAEYLMIYRPYDSTRYKVRVGIGCMPALFDDLSRNTEIYAVKLGDLLEPYGNGDIGLIYIETAHHKVRCKIIDIQKY